MRVSPVPSDALYLLDLELQGVVSCPPWMLETELGSWKRAACPPEH